MRTDFKNLEKQIMLTDMQLPMQELRGNTVGPRRFLLRGLEQTLTILWPKCFEGLLHNQCIFYFLRFDSILKALLSFSS